MYIHTGQARKICLATVGIEPTTFGILAQLAEHWASIPKVVGSIPTVARHIFRACPVWIYTQSNIASIKTYISKKLFKIEYYRYFILSIAFSIYLTCHSFLFHMVKKILSKKMRICTAKTIPYYLVPTWQGFQIAS